MECDIPEFVELMVPIGSWNRTGKKLHHGPRFITIHETSLGLNASERDEHYYINKMFNPPERYLYIGYHYLVTDKKVIRFINDDEYTCHAGRIANNLSIGIERLVYIHMDAQKAVTNQALVTATLLKKHNLPLKNVVTHKFWNGKECPARLLAGMYGGWQGFLKQVEMFLQTEKFINKLF